MRNFTRRMASGILAAAAVALSAGLSLAQSAPPMSFEVVPTGDITRCGDRCVRVIVARGEIVSDTPERFLEFVRQHARDKRMRAVIFVDSPGGLVVSSMRLGLLFRKLGAAAVVARVFPGGTNQFSAASCASACVYALMGAKKRVVPPQSRVVLHRMYAYERFGSTDGSGSALQKTYRNSSLAGKLAVYARTMGVSPDVIRTAESIAPEGIHIATQADLRRWKLAVPSF